MKNGYICDVRDCEECGFQDKLRQEEEETECSGGCRCCPMYFEEYGICGYHVQDLVGEPDF